MELLFNQLILSADKEEFFNILSKYFNRTINEDNLNSIEDINYRQSIHKLYYLLFSSIKEQSYTDLLMEGLLEESYFSEEDAKEVFYTLKKEPKRFYQLAILAHEQAQKIRILCNEIEKVIPNMIWFIKQGYGIILFTFDHGPYASPSIQQYLSDLLTHYQGHLYFSYPYDRLIDTSRFYYPTKLIADMKLSEGKPIIEFAEHYLDTLFTTLNQRTLLYSLIHPNIQRIVRHDQKYHTPYYRTLKTYLENKRQIQPTIEALSINKSTLFYRFKQIGKMLDIDFHDIDLFAYEFSIHIYEYLSK